MSTPSKTALLLMDFQVALAASCPSADRAAVQAAAAAKLARQSGLPTLHGRVAFRGAGIDVSPRNQLLSGAAESGAFSFGAPTADYCAGLEPADDAISFEKRRVGSFAGSDLDVILRSLGADTLVLAGLFTSGVVLSTLREAADRDYRLIVLSDACADPDEEVHAMLMQKVFPAQADVLDVETWASSMSQGE